MSKSESTKKLVQGHTRTLKQLSEDRVKKSKVIAIMNNKGGCGKTATAIALGMYLVRSGNNVLFWDDDAQSNLSHRLGLRDDMALGRRVYDLFRNYDTKDLEAKLRELAIIVDYPYLYRIKGSPVTPGEVGIMGGSIYSEIEAESTNQKIKDDFTVFFRKSLKFYQNFFDYIIIDTSPQMSGNVLCQLAARTADEIIIPCDGLEAAMGLDGFLEWLQSSNSTSNILLAMIKYQDDTGNLRACIKENENFTINNVVYRALKESLGDFVCDTGIKELASLKNTVYGGFGKKTNYDMLCKEIISKISVARPHISNYWNSSVSTKLKNSLLEIGVQTLDKKPVFRNPKFEYLSGGKLLC